MIKTQQTAIQMIALINMVLKKKPNFTAEDILGMFEPNTPNYWKAEGVLQAKGMLPMTEEEQADLDSFTAVCKQILVDK